MFLEISSYKAIFRSSHQSFSKNFAIFTEKHLCMSLFLIKLEALTLLKRVSNKDVSCAYRKIFKNTYFEKHLRRAASESFIFLTN